MYIRIFHIFADYCSGACRKAESGGFLSTCSMLGLATRPAGGRVALKTGLVSLAVLAAAACAFILGSIVMANIVGVPEPADLGGYQPLRGNLVLLLVALPAVWVVSSFGEEVINRGFLITRLAESWGGAGHPPAAGPSWSGP
jgi:membrane protease YdiL (CAAX protease family)